MMHIPHRLLGLANLLLDRNVEWRTHRSDANVVLHEQDASVEKE